MLDTNFLSGGNKGDGRNLFVMGTAAPKGMYLIPGGEMTYTSDNGVRCSDYISVSPGEKITVHIIGTSLGVDTTTFWSRLTWYSAEKAYMSEQTLDNSESEKTPKYFDIYRTFTVPSGVAYTRVSARLYDDGRIKVERGSIATDWTPAPEDVLLKGEVDGRNLFVMADSQIGGISDKGIENEHTDSRKTDFIKASPGDTYIIQGWAESISSITDEAIYAKILFYKEDKSVISKVAKSDNGTNKYFYEEAVAPEETAFYRFVVMAKPEAQGAKFKLERGSIATDWTPAPEDVVTKTPGDIFEAMDGIPEMHRNIFRGKNLGTVFTDEQKAAIANGSFHDLWVGDYWTFDSGRRIQRIVDINYWMGTGNSETCNIPHVVVMPDKQLYAAKMNVSNTVDGAYVESDMYKNGLNQAKDIINTDFGEDFVLNHQIILANKVENGHASAGDFYDSTVELPNEIMMYGCSIFAPMNTGSVVPYLNTTEYTQLALFRLVPKFINPAWQWLWFRDVASVVGFCSIHAGCVPYSDGAVREMGVRPVFGITGGAAVADEEDENLEVTGLSGKGDSSADDLETELSTKGGDPL